MQLVKNKQKMQQQSPVSAIPSWKIQKQIRVLAQVIAQEMKDDPDKIPILISETFNKK